MWRKISLFVPYHENNVIATEIEISCTVKFPDDMHLYDTLTIGKNKILSALMIDPELISRSKSEPVQE